MAFTNFEVNPMVNTALCHICFGTGKPKQQNPETNQAEDKCRHCEGKGFIKKATGNFLD